MSSMQARVFVVDDEPRMADAIAVALGRDGHDCRTFQRADEALAALERDGADVLVTDRKMPGMDGIELMRQALAVDPGLPVILVTAYADVSSAVSAMREGAFDYVAKPFDNDELRALVARALQVTRLHRENRYLRQELADRYSARQLRR